MEVKLGYKQTEVGVIPEDWEVKPLSELFTFGGGFSASREQLSFEGHCYLHYGDIHKSSKTFIDVKTDYQNIPKLDILLKQISPKSLLNDGDVVFVDASEDDEGASKHVVIINKDGIPFISGLHTIVAKSKTDDLEHIYRRYCFQTQNIKSQFYYYVVGTKVTGISKTNITKLLIPIPPLPEQNAIATALSDADTLLQGLEKLIAKKRDIKQGAMQELLTGKRRLPGFEGKKGYKQTEVGVIPEDWELDYIENITKINTGSKNTQDNIEDGQYPFFVRSQNVERINSYSFDGEAVLTAGDGVGTGKIFHYINGKFDVHQRVYRMTDFNTRINGYFFSLYFSQNFYHRIMQMTAKSSVDSVRREMIARMQIPIPPLPEQRAIATALSDMDSEITSLESKLSKARQIKQGMMQELLTGRIRFT